MATPPDVRRRGRGARTWQINGGAFCVDMNTKDARTIGEVEQRLHLVAVRARGAAILGSGEAALA